MLLKVVVVDDDPAILRLFKSMLEPQGVIPITFRDGREAAAYLKREKVDGVFLDVQLPHLDGFELTKQIRSSQQNGHVPVAMFSGLADLQTMRRGFQAGATVFVAKPLDPDKLTGFLKAMRGAMIGHRRRFARLPLRTEVTCRLDGREFKTHSVDISEGGMLLEGSGGAKVDQELELEFSLPESPQTLGSRAKVVYMQAPDRMAVQFVRLVANDQLAIRQYITG